MILSERQKHEVSLFTEYVFTMCHGLHLSSEINCMVMEQDMTTFLRWWKSFGHESTLLELWREWESVTQRVKGVFSLPLLDVCRDRDTDSGWMAMMVRLCQAVKEGRFTQFGITLWCCVVGHLKSWTQTGGWSSKCVRASSVKSAEPASV